MFYLSLLASINCPQLHIITLISVLELELGNFKLGDFFIKKKRNNHFYVI